MGLLTIHFFFFVFHSRRLMILLSANLLYVFLIRFFNVLFVLKIVFLFIILKIIFYISIDVLFSNVLFGCLSFLIISFSLTIDLFLSVFFWVILLLLFFYFLFELVRCFSLSIIFNELRLFFSWIFILILFICLNRWILVEKRSVWGGLIFAL